MSGLTASILLRCSLTPYDTGCVTALLRELTDDVVETRKGRYWEFCVNHTIASLAVLATADNLHDFEDDLLAHDLLFDDAPEVFVVSFGLRRACDREMCKILADRLSEDFGGINCGSDG